MEWRCPLKGVGFPTVITREEVVLGPEIGNLLGTPSVRWKKLTRFSRPYGTGR